MRLAYDTERNLLPIDRPIQKQRALCAEPLERAVLAVTAQIEEFREDPAQCTPRDRPETAPPHTRCLSRRALLAARSRAAADRPGALAALAATKVAAAVGRRGRVR